MLIRCRYKHGKVYRLDTKTNERIPFDEWVTWVDKYGNKEVARMKQDCMDHFFPDTKLIKEERIIGYYD